MPKLRGLWPAICLCLLVGPVSAQVEVRGINGEPRANVLAYLNLAQLGCDAPLWLVRWRYSSAAQEIRQALEPLGYYEVQIQQDLQLVPEQCWHATFDIRLGQPVRVSELALTLEGPLAAEPSVVAWQRELRSLESTQLNHGAYESLKVRLLELAYELGYFDASYLESQVQVDLATRSASIRLHFSSGERYRFGALSFNMEPLQRRLLDAYVPFTEGDPYDARLLGRLRRNLADSSYFTSVQVDANPELAEAGVIPVQVQLHVPDRKRTYAVGAGYATDTGPRLRADTHVRRHNDRGHRSEARLFLSEVQQSVDGMYRMPRRNPLNDWLILDAGFGREATDTATSLLFRTGVRHTYARRQWLETDFIDLRLEDFDVASDSGFSRLLILGKNLTRAWGDTGARPMQGLRLTGEVRGATEYLGSDTDFIQGRIGGRLVQPLLFGHRLLLRAEVAGTWKDEFTDLPASVRFFAGGDNSIRGYAYKSLGPEQDGEVIGGSHLLTASAELDFRILRNWSWALFYDIGSAYSYEPEFYAGVGMGLRWYSPIGPLRVDVAHPLDDPGRSWRLHISLGPDL